MQKYFGNIQVVFEFGKTIPFAELPSQSIALDGFVAGPAVDPERQRYSFDHHADCLRLVTRATCAQVLDALLLGLEPDGFTVYLNDLDADTVLSLWLLLNPEAVHHPLVRDWVEDIERTDAHGPAWIPFQRHAECCQQIYQGALQPLKNQPEHTFEVLLQCLDNIDLLYAGKHFELAKPAERHYEISHQGSNWVMAYSSAFIMDKLYADGYRRVVAWQEAPHQTYAYTLAKRSDLVANFPIPELLAALNALEPGWGGGSTIGGAPRRSDGGRSQLSPDQVFEIIQGHLQHG